MGELTSLLVEFTSSPQFWVGMAMMAPGIGLFIGDMLRGKTDTARKVLQKLFIVLPVLALLIIIPTASAETHTLTDNFSIADYPTERSLIVGSEGYNGFVLESTDHTGFEGEGQYAALYGSADTGFDGWVQYHMNFSGCSNITFTAKYNLTYAAGTDPTYILNTGNASYWDNAYWTVIPAEPSTENGVLYHNLSDATGVSYGLDGATDAYITISGYVDAPAAGTYMKIDDVTISWETPDPVATPTPSPASPSVDGMPLNMVYVLLLVDGLCMLGVLIGFAHERYGDVFAGLTSVIISVTLALAEPAGRIITYDGGWVTWHSPELMWLCVLAALVAGFWTAREIVLIILEFTSKEDI